MPYKPNQLQNEGRTYTTLTAWKRDLFLWSLFQKISNINRMYNAVLCLSSAELLEGQFWKFLALLHPVQWLVPWKNQKICSGRMRFFIFTPHPYSKLLDLPFHFPPFSAVVEMCWKHMGWEKAQIICLSMALLWNPSSTNAKDQLNLQLGQEKYNSLHKQQNKGQDHQ